jgi:hypothetical protein
MKKNIMPKLLGIAAITLLASLRVSAQVEGSNDTVNSKDIIASVHANNIYAFEQVAGNFESQRDQLNSNLLNELQDVRLPNLTRCAAAYYLGEMRSFEAVNILASNITLQFDKSQIKLKHLVKIDLSVYPAMDALTKIGSPAIPALIQNLADNDDAGLRALSLEALYQIDGDKGIVQLRLQKALQSQSNPSKQARLQSALKALGETSFQSDVKMGQP